MSFELFQKEEKVITAAKALLKSTRDFIQLNNYRLSGIVPSQFSYCKGKAKRDKQARHNMCINRVAL